MIQTGGRSALENASFGRDIALRRENDADGRAVLKAGKAAGQLRIVGFDGLSAHKDGVGPGAQEMGLIARRFAGHPDGLARAKRHPAFGVDGELDLNEGPAFGDAQGVPEVDPVRFLGECASHGRDAIRFEPGQTAA